MIKTGSSPPQTSRGVPFWHLCLDHLKRHLSQQTLFSEPFRNTLYCGDCLNELDRIDPESVDLIYIDPPFYSQKYYEVIWNENAERYAFEDRRQGGQHILLE